MTIQTATVQFTEIPGDYAALMQMHPLRPIHDAVDLENATVIIDAMAGHDLTADQEDYLDVLSTLVERYEAEHDPMDFPRVKPLTNLKRLMADHGMSASDLGRLLGNRALGSKILRGQRGLGIRHVKRLAKHFAVDASGFI